MPSVVQRGRVEAVGFQGGLGRRRVDTQSDVDVVLGFAASTDIRDALRGEHIVDGVKVSVFHLMLDRVEPSRWSDKLRYI